MASSHTPKSAAAEEIHPLVSVKVDTPHDKSGSASKQVVQSTTGPDSDSDSGSGDGNDRQSVAASDSSRQSNENFNFGIANLRPIPENWRQEKDERRALAYIARQDFFLERSHFRIFNQLNLLNLTRLQHALVKPEAELEPLICVEMDNAGDLSTPQSKVVEEKLEKLTTTLHSYSRCFEIFAILRQRLTMIRPGVAGS
jgi:hypothetical protein